MLTLPVEADRAVADPPARILVIGRSESVLSELVTILREKGYAAGATNEFDRTLNRFDAGSSTWPSSEEWCRRTPRTTFESRSWPETRRWPSSRATRASPA